VQNAKHDFIPRTDSGSTDMKNIRIFIVCSSTVLMGWLAASYASELESGDANAAASASSPTAPESPLTEATQEQVVSTASLAGIR
jgi:hypothetical protein